MTRHIIPFPMRELDRLFGEGLSFQNEFYPALDVYQDKDHVIAKFELPGVDPEKVDITIENDVLTLSGSNEETKEVKHEDYYRKEVRSGHFSRSVVLPMAVKGYEAQAQYEKGLLTITMPKEESVKPKKISVSVKK